MKKKRVKSEPNELEKLKRELKEKQKEFSILQHAFAALNLKINVLQEIQNLMNTYSELNPLLDKIMDITMHALEVEAGSLLLIDAKKEELYFEVAKGPKAEEVKKYRLKIGEGLVGWCIAQNEPIAISDVKRDPRFKKEISDAIGYEVSSLLCVPIRIKGKVCGAIELLNKQTEDIFTPDDINLLSSIAHLTGLLIENLHSKILSKIE